MNSLESSKRKNFLIGTQAEQKKNPPFSPPLFLWTCVNSALYMGALSIYLCICSQGLQQILIVIWPSLQFSQLCSYMQATEYLISHKLCSNQFVYVCFTFAWDLWSHDYKGLYVAFILIDSRKIRRSKCQCVFQDHNSLNRKLET